MTEQEKHLLEVLELVEIERHILKNRQHRGRPAKNEVRQLEELKRIERNKSSKKRRKTIAELQKVCDRGVKKNELTFARGSSVNLVT